MIEKKFSLFSRARTWRSRSLLVLRAPRTSQCLLHHLEGFFDRHAVNEVEQEYEHPVFVSFLVSKKLICWAFCLYEYDSRIARAHIFPSSSCLILYKRRRAWVRSVCMPFCCVFDMDGLCSTSHVFVMLGRQQRD